MPTQQRVVGILSLQYVDIFSHVIIIKFIRKHKISNRLKMRGENIMPYVIAAVVVVGVNYFLKSGSNSKSN